MTESKNPVDDGVEHGSRPVRGVLSAWLSGGKMWWGVSLTIQVLASFVAAMAAFVGSVSPEWALILGVASIGGLLGRWRADFLRQSAEGLLRQVELEDGLDWKLSPKVVADSLSRGIAFAKSAANRAREQSNFYFSTRQPGPLRAMDNLRESAWWTQQNAQWMGWRAVWLVVVLSMMAVSSLLVAATVVGPSNAIEVSRLLTAGISVVFAGNLVRLPFEYFRLANNASEADRNACALGMTNSATEAQAVRLLGDYQLARAMGPPIPDWVWRARRNHLNDIWRQTRASG